MCGINDRVNAPKSQRERGRDREGREKACVTICQEHLRSERERERERERSTEKGKESMCVVEDRLRASDIRGRGRAEANDVTVILIEYRRLHLREGHPRSAHIQRKRNGSGALRIAHVSSQGGTG